MAHIVAAPVVGKAATAAGGRAATGAAAKKGASTAAGAASKGTAPARASELLASGTSRTTARRTLRDEFGGTIAETDALLDAATSSTDSTPAEDAAPAQAAPSSSARKSSPSSPALPKVAREAISAGGGALLGALVYVLALTYLRDGKAGVKRWMAAKFLNRVEPS